MNIDEIVEAYALSLDSYYKYEKKFREDPSKDTLGAYHSALDRIVVLRDECARSMRLGHATSDLQFEPILDEIAEALGGADPGAALSAIVDGLRSGPE